jgi:putative methanogenesis marker protein 5
MAKVFIYPTTSLILSDLVARYGHTPLSSATAIRERVQTAGIESVPLQITPEEPKKGLRWAAVEVPSGVRGQDGALRPDDRGVRCGDRRQ